MAVPVKKREFSMWSFMSELRQYQHELKSFQSQGPTKQGFFIISYIRQDIIIPLSENKHEGLLWIKALRLDYLKPTK